MQYRREIDGLRAVAVLPVIFFHAGFDGFRGGFIGVDVFFVISGYLITSIIANEIDEGNFTVRRFYERRARRILPALFAVMAASCVFSWFLIPPEQFREFGRSLIAVSLFASNVLFWSEAGYFAAAAEEKPLLHTWSLAVEEQFYIVFPLLLLALWRLGGTRVKYLVAAMGLLSLGLSEWGAHHMSGANFYLAPTRAWELLIGAYAALMLREGGQERPAWLVQLLSLAGLAMVLYSALRFDGTMPLPGLYALVPTVGTVLIILFARPTTAVGRVLSMKAFVGLGLISYSAYLWHQPVLAFLRLYRIDPLTDGIRLAIVAVTLLLAVLSWQFVEKPFRDHKRVTAKAVAAFSILGSIAFCAIGASISAMQGVPSRFDFQLLESGSLQRSARETECFDAPRIHERKDGWNCRIGVKAEGKTPDFILYGDSHAFALIDTFDATATRLGRSGIFTAASGCIPFMGVYLVARLDQTNKNCHALNLRIAELVKSEGIKQVFLVGRWSYYTDGDYEGSKINYLSTRPDGPATKEESRRAFVAGLEQTVRYYGDLGVKVVIVLQVPMQPLKPGKVLIKATRAASPEEKQAILLSLSVRREDHRRLMAFVEGTFRPYRNIPNVTIADPSEVLCDGQTCAIASPNVSYYFDDDHLSLAGARRLGGMVGALLK